MADWTPFGEGDKIRGAEIASRLSAVGTEINNLDETAIPDKSLNRDHLPKSTYYLGSKVHTGEATKVSSYKYSFPGWPTARMSGTGWDRMPLDLGYTSGSGRGWYNTLPNSTASISLDFTRDTGLLALANAHVSKLNWTYQSAQGFGGGFVQPKLVGAASKAGGSSPDGTADITGSVKPTYLQGNTTHVYGFFMLALKDMSGNYYPVPKTLRYIDSDTNTNSDSTAEHRSAREIPDGEFAPENSACKAMPRVYKDVPIRSFIRKIDILPREVGGTVPNVFTHIQLLACVRVNHAPIITGKHGIGYLWVRETRVTGLTPKLGLGNTYYFTLDGSY